MPKISELTGAAALTGTETVAGVQGGGSVKITTQDIADLASGSGLSNVVEDTTPQLGGDLDVNGNSITSSFGELDITVSTITLKSLVNNGTVRLQGADGGTVGGSVVFETGNGTSIGGAVTFDLGADLTDSSNDGYVQLRPAGLYSPELRFLERPLSGTQYIAIKGKDILGASRTWTLPNDDPSTADGEFLTTDSSGVWSFSDVPGVDLGEYTVAGLPSASSNANGWALATDASGGRTIVRSDGTNWKVVAVEGATVTT